MKRDRRSDKSRRIGRLILVFCLVFAMAVPAPAVTVKNVPRRNQTSSKRLVDKKVVDVSTGTTVLRTLVNGYIRFTAKEAGTYQFTFSGVYPLTSLGTECQYAFMLPFKVSGKKLKQVKVKMGTKKVKEIWIASEYGYAMKPPASVTSTTPIPSRTVQISMKKGQSYYFYLYFGSGTYRCALKIKQK